MVLKIRCVSGHDFSRAEKSNKASGFSPCGPKLASAKPFLKHALDRTSGEEDA
jgi:hypothetical protein